MPKSKMNLRYFNLKFVVFLFAALINSMALGEEFPSRPIKIVVPFGAGGVADLCARAIGEELSKSLNQAIIIENKPGAGGITASDLVAKATPDGHTLLLMSNSNAISANLFNKLPFNTIKDFSPISTIGFFDMAIYVDRHSPYKTLQDLIRDAKANPTSVSIATINIGSTQNLTAELIKSKTQLNFQIIPFNNSPAVLTAVMGKQVSVGIDILTPIISQSNSGNIRILATTGKIRSPFLKNIPSARESGVPGIEASSWNGLAAPAKTPTLIINQLNAAIKRALSKQEVKRRLNEIYVSSRASTPQEMQYLLESEIVHWGAIIHESKIPKQ